MAVSVDGASVPAIATTSPIRFAAAAASVLGKIPAVSKGQRILTHAPTTSLLTLSSAMASVTASMPLSSLTSPLTGVSLLVAPLTWSLSTSSPERAVAMAFTFGMSGLRWDKGV